MKTRTANRDQGEGRNTTMTQQAETRGRLIINTPDYRRHEAKRVLNALKQNVWTALCEEFIPESGRWEPFYTYRNGPDR